MSNDRSIEGSRGSLSEPALNRGAMHDTSVRRFSSAPRSIRTRLQWWYGVVYVASLVLFGSVVYWRADRDVRERATQQVVSTVEYLDVSLRQYRPDRLRSPEEFRGDAEGNPVRSLPPRDRRQPRESRFPGRPFPEPGDPGGAPPEIRLPPEIAGHPGPPFPGEPAPFGPRDELLSAIRPPGVHRSPGPDEHSGPFDRIEYTVWLADGTILVQNPERAASPAMTPDLRSSSPAPLIRNLNEEIAVTKRGPHGTFIRAVRPLTHDLAVLHRFGYQTGGLAVLMLAAGLVGGWWISGRIVSPIARISETASAISAVSLNQRIATADLDLELVQLAVVLNRTFERLEQSFGRLTQFTADASHELRTPLAVIQSQMELSLSKPRSPESYQETLAICLKSSERMRSLVDGLLLLARADADRLELRPVRLDLRNVAEDVVFQLQQKAADSGVEIECTAPENEVLIEGDSRFIPQIPFNLIHNAIQHSSQGGKISVEVRLEQADAVFTVRDTGSGIAAEHLPHLFDRFYRADAGRSRKHGGSGLGLAICRSLVEAHGGTIGCESRPGEGSVFQVRFPAVRDVSCRC